MRCLIVDDEVLFCESIKRAMAREEWEVEFAHDGHTAIRKLSSESFDLLILDIRLPGAMTGIDVACFRYSDPTLRRMPVVIVSGMTDVDIQRSGSVNVFSGPTVILTKPFPAEELAHYADILVHPPNPNEDAPKPP